MKVIFAVVLVCLALRVYPTKASSTTVASDCLNPGRGSTFSRWNWTASDGRTGTMSILARDTSDSNAAVFVIRDLLGKTFTGHTTRTNGWLILSANAGPTGSDLWTSASISAQSSSSSLTGWFSIAAPSQPGRTMSFTANLTSCGAAQKIAVVLQGIDSHASCSDKSRYDGVADALKQARVSAEVVGFSYSVAVSPVDGDGWGWYQDCRTNGYVYTGPGAVDGMAPLYDARDTCNGVALAAALLEGSLQNLANKNPGAEFILVGHSLGGVIAAYTDAVGLPPALRVRVSGMVLLDSPVNGFPLRSPLSTCLGTQSSADLVADSPVLQAISNPLNGLDRGLVTSVVSSPVGDATLAGSQVISANCYSSGGPGFFAGLFGFLVNPILGFLSAIGGYAVDVGTSHSCVLTDQRALDAIVDAVRR